jgi:DNA invertase Pin-like site-specific DNA recombinase
MYKEYPKFYSHRVKKYGRKSRTDDPLLTIEEVLEKHNKIMDEYAERYLVGGPIPEENYYMEVASGESLKERPEITRLLKDIEDPEVQAIMVVEVQRLSRGDLEDAGRLIRILRYTNTYVITPTKTYDLRDDYDRDAFERELKRGSEYLEYYKKIQARGKLASVKDGNYIGNKPPYGYDLDAYEEGKKICHTLKINEEEANVVRMIFDWYCNEDIGVTAICRRLESLGIKTKTGEKIWSSTTIFRILENEHYIGCVRWNWRKLELVIEDQEIRKTRPKPEEYLLFEGKHEAIISKEQFELVRKIRGKRHRTNTDKTLKNPLSGLIYCKRCGSRMTYNTYRKDGIEYAPPRMHCTHQTHCGCGSVLYQEIMKHICDVLKESIEDFELRVQNQQDDSAKLHLKLVKRLKDKMVELEKKELAQWEALHDPDPTKRMPNEIFQKLNKKLLEEKEEVKNALCEAENSNPTPVDYRDCIIRFTDALNMLNDPGISARVKNRYLKNIIKRIEYDRPPSVRITRENRHLYEEELNRGSAYHWEPYELSIELRV